jgi:CBS domain-containing protein
MFFHLQGMRISAVLTLRTSVVVISSGATVREALDILATNNITSAPLFDFVNNNYYGFLDVQGTSANLKF